MKEQKFWPFEKNGFFEEKNDQKIEEPKKTQTESDAQNRLTKEQKDALDALYGKEFSLKETLSDWKVKAAETSESFKKEMARSLSEQKEDLEEAKEKALKKAKKIAKSYAEKKKEKEEEKVRRTAPEEEKQGPKENKLLPQRTVSREAKRNEKSAPAPNETLDLDSTTFRSFMEEKKGKKTKAKAKARRDLSKRHMTAEEVAAASLDGMYGVYRDPAQNKKRLLTFTDVVRYGILFVCIFGFLLAGLYVFRKGYDYYRSYVVYSGLQKLVTEKDKFSDEYLKKAAASIDTLTPAEVLAGKVPEGQEGTAYTEAQETLVGKIGQLKKINPDTVGWISIKGTAVNYPLLYSSRRNYYLRRDFYGKVLSGGAIFMDDRNDPDITKNRNTVIYGHNMADGSMFASVHDFANASVFYGSTIEIATQDGIFVYTPFSVHQSNAFDNYFETDFVSDEDFIHFCEQMAFISLFETNTKFSKNSQIITLSTCVNNENATDERFAVHAILTGVIR